MKKLITNVIFAVLICFSAYFSQQAAMYYAGNTGSAPTFEGPSVLPVSNIADPMNQYYNHYGRHSPRQAQWGSRPRVCPSNGFNDYLYADNF